MKRTKASVKLSCDKLFRQLVLIASDERCQATGQRDIALEVHHLVVKRRPLETRWLLDNGVSVSPVVHRKLEASPKLNEEWGRLLLGNLQYDYIMRLGRTHRPWTLSDIIDSETELRRQISKWERAARSTDFWLTMRRAVSLPGTAPAY